MSKAQPWPPAAEAITECKKVLGLPLYVMARESCFQVVTVRRKWQEEAAIWDEAVRELGALQPKLGKLGRKSRRPEVSTRHGEFVERLQQWIQAGRDLIALARHVEPAPSPREGIDHERSRIADRLVALERREALGRAGNRAGRTKGRRKNLFTDEIAVLLDIASGRAAPRAMDPVVSWDRLHDAWHKALMRARKRSRRQRLTRAGVAKLLERERELHKPRLPARPLIVAEMFKKNEGEMPSDEELLYWSVEDPTQGSK
jgi:hypothetical protein